MNRIRIIRVDYEGKDNYIKQVDIQTPEELFQLLIDLNIYDDIQATKHFSTGKRVIDRMKGE